MPVCHVTLREILPHGTGTIDAMGKWRPPLDSAHQIGPLTLSLVILIAVDGCKRRGYKFRKSGMFCLTEQQPVELWGNGRRRWIQRIK
jgi:hypothetical protein